MHRLLKRQLRRVYGKDAEIRGELAKLLDAVDKAYHQYDDDRQMLERSLDLSSSELLTANGELHALFSSLPDLFIRVGSDRRVIAVPGGQRDDVNMRADANLRGALNELLVADAMAAVETAWVELAQTSRSATRRYRIGDDQEAQHFEARLIPLRNHEVMIIISDATDRVRQANVEVSRREQAARMKAMEEFAYVASHDLRAPLRAIAQLSEWIAEDIGDRVEGETQRQLTLLQQRVARMDSLLVGLLDYSRVGRDKVEVEELDLGALTQGVVQMLDDETFTFDVAQMPVVTTARGPLERVLLNLITNALKHHDRGHGRIAVGCTEGDDLLTFWVEDDGPGIPDGDRERVFKMFQKLRRRDEVEGNGMGLALIKRIVEDAGGTISLAPASPRGTRFTFTWPRHWRSHAVDLVD